MPALATHPMELEILGQERRQAPNNVICLARTYPAHAVELGNAVPCMPTVFFKPNSALVGDGADIVLPRLSCEVHHEVELAVVIGRTGRALTPEEALEHVLGYAILLDITARDLQDDLKRHGLPWAYAKGWDTFAPISAVTPADRIPNPDDLDLRLWVSGELRQDSNTRHLTTSVPDLISFVSSFMTLQPGDVIATGTPEGVGPLHDGDTTLAEIPGLGTLRNQVVDG